MTQLADPPPRGARVQTVQIRTFRADNDGDDQRTRLILVGVGIA
jgi:hypothetical protein